MLHLVQSPGCNANGNEVVLTSLCGFRADYIYKQEPYTTTRRTCDVVKEMSVVETYNKTQKNSQKNMQRIMDQDAMKIRCREPKN